MFRFLRQCIDNFSNRWAVARINRADDKERAEKLSAPRLWKFVNAYGPGQTLSPVPMTHADACKFCREIIGHGYIQTDFAGSIIFYAGPRPSPG